MSELDYACALYAAFFIVLSHLLALSRVHFTSIHVSYYHNKVEYSEVSKRIRSVGLCFLRKHIMIIYVSASSKHVLHVVYTRLRVLENLHH